VIRRDWVLRKKDTEDYYTGSGRYGDPVYGPVGEAHLWGGHDVTADKDEEVVEVEVITVIRPIRVDNTWAERNAVKEAPSA
jgi:hypothetical protein